MNDENPFAKDDVVQQGYKGPSMLAAGLGEGAIQTKFFLLGGALFGGVAAALFPAESKLAVKKMDAGLTKVRDKKSLLLRLPMVFVDLFVSLGKDLGGLTRQAIEKLGTVESIKNTFPKFFTPSGLSKAEITIEGAVYASTITSTLGSLVGTGLGARHAYQGKQQFEQSKAEIIALRENNQVLNEKLSTHPARPPHAAKIVHNVSGNHSETRHSEQEKPPASWAEAVTAEKENTAEATRA